MNDPRIQLQSSFIGSLIRQAYRQMTEDRRKHINAKVQFPHPSEEVSHYPDPEIQYGFFLRIAESMNCPSFKFHDQPSLVPTLQLFP
ncbi:hypothetical protein HN873_006103 [Arachis hypogaea]